MFIKATQSEPTCGWQPDMGFWRVLYRGSRIIGHFTVHIMTGDIFFQGVSLSLLAFLVSCR